MCAVVLNSHRNALLFPLLILMNDETFVPPCARLLSTKAINKSIHHLQKIFCAYDMG